mgnify:CR=1 FL=1
MKKEHKPGELFNAFQEKKRKHEKHMKHRKSVGDQPSMATWNPNQNIPNFAHPKPMMPKLRGGVGSPKVAVKMKHRKHKKNWIAGAVGKHPGALHRELGIKSGNKIPAKTLAHAAKAGGKEGKRARLAETLKGFHHKKHRKMTQAQDDAYDKKHGIKEGSKEDIKQDEKEGIHDKKKHTKHKKGMHCKSCTC